MIKRDKTYLIIARLKELMDQKGIASVTQLSKDSGIPQPTLHKLFSGKTQNPRHSLLVKIADYFLVPTSYLLADNTTTVELVDTPLYFLSDEAFLQSDASYKIALDQRVDFVVRVSTNKFFPEIFSGSLLLVKRFTEEDLREGVYLLHGKNSDIDIGFLINGDSGWLLRSISKNITDQPISIPLSDQQVSSFLGAIIEIRRDTSKKN